MRYAQTLLMAILKDEDVEEITKDRFVDICRSLVDRAGGA